MCRGHVRGVVIAHAPLTRNGATSFSLWIKLGTIRYHRSDTLFDYSLCTDYSADFVLSNSVPHLLVIVWARQGYCCYSFEGSGR